MTSILSAIEAFALIAILSVAHVSTLPKPAPSVEAIDQESERNTAACDAEGGEWHMCTLREMQRTMK